jgi:hypothetical protein
LMCKIEKTVNHLIFDVFASRRYFLLNMQAGMRKEYEWRKVDSEKGQSSCTIRSNSAGIIKGSDFFLFAGKGVGLLDVVWKYSLTENVWTLVNCLGQLPCRRDGHSSTLIENKAVPYDVILFGGQSTPEVIADTGENDSRKPKALQSRVKTISSRSLLGDTYAFNCSTSTWRRIDPSMCPPLRRGHSCILWKRPVNFKFEPIHAPHHDDDYKPTMEEQELLKQQNIKKKEKEENQAQLKSLKLVVYGGSGIDPVRGEEKILNDIWLYSFEDNSWALGETHGERPSGSYNHTCTIVGDDMIISGGIHPPKYNGTPTLSAQDHSEGCLFILDLPNMTWSTLQLHKPNGSIFEFPMHGHTMVLNPSQQFTMLLYGGRETVSALATANRKDSSPPKIKSPKHSNNRKMSYGNNMPHASLTLIDLQRRLATPIDPVGEFQPEARFGHVALTVPIPRRRKNGNMADSYPVEESKSKLKPVPIMVLYGGNKSDQGGYCNGEVYELFLKNVPNRKPDDKKDVEMFGGELEDAHSVTSASHGSPVSLREGHTLERASSPPSGTRSPGGGVGALTGMSVMSGIETGVSFQNTSLPKVESPSRKKSPGKQTLWVKSLRPILGPSTRKKGTMPSNFDELKLALTYPLSYKHDLDSPLHDRPAASLGRKTESEAVPQFIADSDFRRKEHKKQIHDRVNNLGSQTKRLNITNVKKMYKAQFPLEISVQAAPRPKSTA